MDKYSSYSQLTKSEQEGVDYTVIVRQSHGARVAILAPHGGRIEPMTDEIADRIAGNEFSLYCFKGCKKNGNCDLHITSHNFDEPRCLELIRNHEWVIAIHGCSDRGEGVFLGGLDRELIKRLADALSKVDISVMTKGHKYLATLTTNICNRGALNAGVQFELTLPFRNGSRLPRFIDTVREVLFNHQRMLKPR